MSKIAIFLWFDGQAEAAADFYVSTFQACGQDATTDRPAGTGGKAMSASFTLAGQDFIALNGGPHFTFSPAMSLFVRCADQAEVDQFWERLSDGGEPQRCGWLKDRFGVSWQIVPTALGEMLQAPDRTAAGRVMEAMMGMTKLDIAGLRAAYNGPADA